MRSESATTLSRALPRGFTMIELMITLIIVGILAGLAAPSFSSFIADQRVKAASFDLMAAMTLARSEAIKRNAVAGAAVSVVPTGGAWANGWTITAPDGTVISREDAQRNLSIACISGGAAVACSNVSYLGSGRLAAAPPALQLSAASTQTIKCITLDLSGRPSSRLGACP